MPRLRDDTPRGLKFQERRKRQQRFLRKLREYGTVYEACRRSDLNHQIVYQWAQSDPSFRKRLLEAKDCAVQRLETSAFRRALKGDTLLTIFLLKAYRPEMYRDRYEGRIDEDQLNAAIERELDRVAGGGTPKITGVIEGEVRPSADSSPPASEGVPESDV